MTHGKLFTALILGSALAFTTPAFADSHEGKHGKKWEEIKKLSPEEREKFKAERKAKWDALSKEEKLKVIEERRANMRQKMDERWNAMSDDEKIAFTEKRFKPRGDRSGFKGKRDHKPKQD